MTNGPTKNESLNLQIIQTGIAGGAWSAASVVAESHRRIAADQRAGIWITIASDQHLRSQLDAVESRRRRGESLPLLGVPVAVKDNIDVAGLPTTAACAEFAYTPAVSAKAVQKLTDAGAIVMGKTNLDQFATGLVGARSPYGVGRSAIDSRYISGGSSSGSALAVAAGLVPISLGTDTAGSGRIPAAFNNIVGLKPTKGLISTMGVVPACRSLDCVSIFAQTVGEAETVLEVMAGFDPADSYSRMLSLSSSPALESFRFGRPSDDQLQFFDNAEYAEGFRNAIAMMKRLGGEEVIIDFTPFEQTARLLYEGPWVAERVAGIKQFWEERKDVFFPVTRQIFSGAARYDAVATFSAMHRLADLSRQAETQWQKMDLLLLPTSGTTYTVEEVVADPVVTNTNLGYYTNFVNLLDLCGLAIPSSFLPSGLPYGITLLAMAAKDKQLAVVGKRFEKLSELIPGAARIDQ